MGSAGVVCKLISLTSYSRYRTLWARPAPNSTVMPSLSELLLQMPYEELGLQPCPGMTRYTYAPRVSSQVARLRCNDFCRGSSLELAVKHSLGFLYARERFALARLSRRRFQLGAHKFLKVPRFRYRHPILYHASFSSSKYQSFRQYLHQ